MSQFLFIKNARLKFGFYLVGLLLCLFLISRLECIERHPILFNSSYVLSFLFLFELLRFFPDDWPERRQWLLIALVAVLTRLAFFPYPASNDVNRYIWEGYIANQGFNPYLLPPDSPALKSYIIEIWHPISHKKLTACYPPLAMLLFRAAAWLSPTIPSFKGMMILFDLGVIWVLALLLQQWGLRPHRILLYALNPLVLVFIAGEGHLDVIQVFFLMLTFYLLGREHASLAFFSLGCSVMVKYFAVLIAPFIIDARNWKNSFWFLAPVILTPLPFWGTGINFFSSLIFFGTENTYNESITLLLREILGIHSVVAGMILLAVFLAMVFAVVHQPLKGSYLVLGGCLLLLTTLNPWYLVLITPFLVFFPSRAWLYLQIAMVPVLYLQYHTAMFYRSYWITALEYIPFYGLAVWDVYQSKTILLGRRFGSVSTVSVVVPAINEAHHIAECLKGLQTEKTIFEVIVVDGGSQDETPEIARAMGARVLQTGRGRGHQIKSGIDQCRGEVILILHGDCRIREGAIDRMIAALNRRAECAGGSMAMSYAAGSASSLMLAWLNNARSRWMGISFGDQAQFFRREALSLMKGFPDLMLMEDVELSMRLKEIGPVCFVPNGVVASNRRWARTGFWLNSLKVLRICFSYLLRRRLKLADAKGASFYELYYHCDRPS